MAETHTLLRIRRSQDLRSETGLPPWVDESLRRAPWVVVRRAPTSDGLLPVGVRGESRQQRFAAWVSSDEVLELVTPRTLASGRVWATAVDQARRAAVPALAALDAVEKIMAEQGLVGTWGPAGSVGFELASGRVTATLSSDLDLVIAVDRLAPAHRFASTVDRLAAIAGSLWAALAILPARVDVLLETPGGAVALSEYVRARDEGGSFVLRTTEGPRLTRTLGHPLGLEA
jgi:phosphoribosyl-dephospho-CoA transferase